MIEEEWRKVEAARVSDAQFMELVTVHEYSEISMGHVKIMTRAAGMRVKMLGERVCDNDETGSLSAPCLKYPIHLYLSRASPWNRNTKRKKWRSWRRSNCP